LHCLTSDSYPLWIKNSGTAPLDIFSVSFGLSDSPFQLLDSSFPMVIAVGDSASIPLIFTPQAGGMISDSIYIHNSSFNAPIFAVELWGSGDYAPPKPPAGIETTIDGNNFIISWEAVTETIFDNPIDTDFYLVFSCDSAENDANYYWLIGSTPDLSFTDNLDYSNYRQLFYRVRAYKNYCSKRFSFDQLGLAVGMTESEVLEKLRSLDSPLTGSKD